MSDNIVFDQDQNIRSIILRKNIIFLSLGSYTSLFKKSPNIITKQLRSQKDFGSSKNNRTLNKGCKLYVRFPTKMRCKKN